MNALNEIQNMKLTIKTLNELIDNYQDNQDCLINRLTNFEEEFKSKQDDNLLQLKALELNKEFATFYNDFFKHYAFFFNESNNDQNKKKIVYRENAEYTKIYLDSCSLNILKLNTNYIQPLTNKITIKKANTSICWGKWSVGFGLASVILGLAATIVSYCYSRSSDETINSLKQDLSKQEIIINDNKKILNTLDSLAKVNNTNVLYLIETFQKATNNP